MRLPNPVRELRRYFQAREAAREPFLPNTSPERRPPIHPETQSARDTLVRFDRDFRTSGIWHRVSNGTGKAGKKKERKQQPFRPGGFMSSPRNDPVAVVDGERTHTREKKPVSWLVAPLGGAGCLR